MGGAYRQGCWTYAQISSGYGQSIHRAYAAVQWIKQALKAI